MLHDLSRLSLNDWLALSATICAVIGIVSSILAKIFKSLGWNKGALIAGQLQEGFLKAQTDIANVKTGTITLDQAAAKVAAHTTGVNADIVKPIIADIVEKNETKKYGVNVTMDSEGNISVDPSGLVQKSAHKLSKFFKKVF